VAKLRKRKLVIQQNLSGSEVYAAAHKRNDISFHLVPQS